MSTGIHFTQEQRDLFLGQAILDDRIPDHIYDYLVESDFYVYPDSIGIATPDDVMGDMFRWSALFPAGANALTDCAFKANIANIDTPIRLFMQMGLER